MNRTRNFHSTPDAEKMDRRANRAVALFVNQLLLEVLNKLHAALVLVKDLCFAIFVVKDLDMVKGFRKPLLL